MNTIDLNSEKTLTYKVNEIDIAEKANLILTFPNDIVYRFEAEIKKELNEIHVNIPILKNIIQKEMEVNSYLEVWEKDRFYKIGHDTILFTIGQPVDIKFEGENKNIEATLINRNEVDINAISIITKKVNYKKGN